jgi:hypothetical protein
MTQIVLTPDQVTLYNQAKEPVQICDTQGRVLGTLPPDYSADFIAQMKRRAASAGPWYSGDEVQAMFRFLEEAEAKEGKINDKRLNELLESFAAQHGRSI